LAVEFRQYGAEGSVLQNVPTRVHPAETLLKQAVWWIDSAHSGSSGQAIKNLGWGGAALDATAGSTTAADSNDPLYLPWDGINYVYLPGVISNYLSTPDATALDITGDIDLRALVALDNWTSGATQRIVSKYDTTTNQRSYTLFVTSGVIGLLWSNNGTAFNSTFSTIAPTVTDGTQLWIRATLDVDNGASGSDVKFFTSTNGTTWTQLGTTVTTAGVTSIYSGTAPVEIGSRNVGTTEPLAGKIYRAQILNGIDGVPVLDVDTSVVSTGAATSFTALTGQTVTINRSTSGRKTTCVTHPVWLFGTDDYMEVNNRWLEHAAPSENYVYLTNVTGNYLSVADNPPLDITSDLDIQVKVAMDDWTAADRRYLLSKYVVTGNQCSYNLRLEASGVLQLVWSPDGNNANAIAKSSTVAPTVADGATLWVRATLDVDNGAGGNDVKFFTSTDGTTWTQLGSTVTTAGVTSVYSGTAPVEIGSFWGGIVAATASPLKFFRGIIKNGIDGTIVLDADASIITDGTASTFRERSSNAYTVTINKSGTGTFASTNNYLYLPGVASNYASAPDAAPLDITGDIDIRCKVAMDDWTPGAVTALTAKYNPGTAQRSWYLSLNTNGTLALNWTTDGTNTTLAGQDSSVATGVADGATKWVRATLDVDNGAGGYDLKYWLSDDGTAWTQLGTTRTGGSTTSIFSGTALQEIGSWGTGTTNPARGKFFRAQVLNGIGGTVAFDANFESSIVGNLPTTFTEGSTNAATVTVNYSGTGYRSAGVIASTYVFPGNPNTFKLSAYSLLDFGATDSFTVVAILREWATPSNSGRIVTKGAAGSSPYWYLRNNGTGFQSHLRIGDGTNIAAGYSNTSTAGTLLNYTSTIDRTAQLITGYLNGSSAGGATGSTTSVGSIATPTEAMRVGSDSGGGTPNDMEFVAAAIFRRALTSGEITTLNSYFQGRVA
jgi:hypothetical protein